MASDLKGAVLLSRTRDRRDFVIPNQPEASVGYDRGNDVAIPFEGVSRRHARIAFDGKDYWIEDVGSANGTYLNAVRLVQKERLKHLDVVTLGRRADLIFVRRAVEDAPRRAKRGIVAAKLEFLDGMDAGTLREIPKGSVTIGRSAGNNIVADSQLVSKVHARIERSGVELVLTDLQSANGTFVNGERVDTRILKNGDEVSVGRARSYRVRLEEGEVLTGDVSVSDRVGQTATPSSLPLDWKTHMEWSPEEAALIERARAAKKPAGVTDPQDAAKGETAPAPKAAPPKAAKPAAEKPAAPPAKPPAEKPAAAEKKEAAKPAAEPPKADAEKPAEPPPPKPPAEKPAAAQPAAAVPPAPPPSPAPEAVAKPAAPAEPAPPAMPAPEPPKPPAAKPAAEKPAVAPPPPKPAEPKPPPPPPSPPPTAPPPLRERRDNPREATRALTPAQLPKAFLESAARTFPLALGTYEIGRDPAADIRLPGNAISRKHARLRIDEHEAVLEDLKTVNGTSVNGQRLVAPRQIADGDEVMFGSMKFRFRFGAGYPKK